MEKYKTLSDASKVWIYQSNRPFSSEELIQLQPLVQQFAAQWASHDNKMKSFGGVLYEEYADGFKQERVPDRQRI